MVGAPVYPSWRTGGRAPTGRTRLGVSFFPVYLATNGLPAIETGNTSGLVVDELDEPSVNALRVRNPGDKPLLVVEGEHFLGGKQNRAVNVTVLVPALGDLEIPVSCLEQGRWGRRRAARRDEAFTATRVRAAKNAGVAASMRRSGSRDGDQGAVWREVDEMLNRASVQSTSRSGKQPAEIPTTLQRLVQTSALEVRNATVHLNDRSSDDIPAPSGDLVGTALEAALDFVENHRNGNRRGQMMNVVTLMKAADIHATSTQVSRTFRIIQSWLKSSGDKRLVLVVARRSIEASRVSPHGGDQVRGRKQVEDEAVAAICGLSWVYQRTGRLAEALAEAERSLALGQALHPPWDRNTAFCHKCLGRLKRMQSEDARYTQHRTKLLNDSVELFLKAIDEFTKLGLEGEVGDCYSLLARTYLVTGDRGAARDAVREAEERLIDPTNKDYLDLQIVKGDLMLHVSRRTAESIYTEMLPGARTDADGALATVDVDDAQKSEIMARAYLQRGKVRAALGDATNARTDFEQAANIWDDLADPTADSAYWEIEGNALWIDTKNRPVLMREHVGVRVRAARIVGTETTQRPVGRSHRREVPRRYLDDVIRRAREQLVRDRPAW